MFDILDSIFVDGRFSRFMDLIQESGLIAELKTPDPMTLFAPTDDAFAAVHPRAIDGLLADKPRLQAFIRGHVAAGALPTSELRRTDHVDALDHTSRSVQAGATLRIGDARVVEGDIDCSNGLVHAVDGVLAEDLLTSTALG
jgi:uncharacterized surface protein with fasciclin (FAS1) repeats